MRSVETGRLCDRFPYVRVGKGSRPLVVVPGVDDAMFSGRYPIALGWMLRGYFSRFVGDRAVYVISRPRGLPEEHTIADMADGYAEVLEAELGPADVLGISMGGMIAQELGVRHPDLVETVVLANSGCRVDDPERIRRLLAYARERDWARIRADLGVAMFTDWRAVTYPAFVLTLGRFAIPRPAVPADVTVSLEAIRAFDATGRLADVDAPTLVFGGTDDPFFPEPILEATAAGIPDAELSMIRGGKHGAYHERKLTFDDRVDAFLEERTGV